MRRWTIAAGIAGSIAAITGIITAWPMVKEWWPALRAFIGSD